LSLSLLGCGHFGDELGSIGECNLACSASATIANFDNTSCDTTTSDDDARCADEFGVFKSHTRRNTFAIVKNDSHMFGAEFFGEFFTSACSFIAWFAGNNDVNIGW